MQRARKILVGAVHADKIVLEDDDRVMPFEHLGDARANRSSESEIVRPLDDVNVAPVNGAKKLPYLRHVWRYGVCFRAIAERVNLRHAVRAQAGNDPLQMRRPRVRE